VPVLTDVHEYTPMDEVASVVDVLQTPGVPVPADRLHPEGGRSAGKPVNIKKGQFLSPLGDEARRRQGAGHRQRPQIMVCERGASFGYNNLVSTCARSR
jgi:2-dehydro-3-deoxyphosphooctonate aldolase (KDO 8-P synthase)